MAGLAGSAQAIYTKQINAQSMRILSNNIKINWGAGAVRKNKVI